MTKEKMYYLGIDIGSTTAKIVLLDENDKVVYQKYQRHMSRVRETTLKILSEMRDELFCEYSHTDSRGEASENSRVSMEKVSVKAAISGSAGLGVAESAGIAFVQEVYATGEVVSKLSPDTGVVIELGGEDAKVIFYKGGVDERMNGTCAGGTGAFIDQMAVLLDMTVDEMDAESLKASRIYPIASRCGVFAKTDIQPLLNQGASKADIAASIYQAVVNQTITGLIRGSKIEGKVMFLGGPLYYCTGLQKRFCETLKLDGEHAIFPQYGLYSVAMGAAMYAEEQAKECSLDDVINSISQSAKNEKKGSDRLPALFASEAEYVEFCQRHESASVAQKDISEYSGKAWLGIDCGSTTTKLCLVDEDKSIIYSYYSSNKGNPVSLVKEVLMEIRRLCGDRITICGCSVTGYGEELIKNAFHTDEGVVETIAHYTAAKHFQPDVDFILDIGGQDIKCFKIRNGAIDSIMLNEACSSGCGSFIETFAKSMGYEVAEFAERGLHGKAPVNLGSRCTVFMNSSVKQSQKDGASVEDISAGLSISVVKNAIYKVIRAASPDDLGKNIVVQGGTFYNNAVLRAFENELGRNVIRPAVAGLMGAYGAALHIMKCEKSTLLSLDELESFTHESTSAVCKGCANACHLTVNKFADGKRFISGNQCEKGLGLAKAQPLPNLYEWKREYFESLKPQNSGDSGVSRGKIALPMALSVYELAPLWHEFFTRLGFEVHFSSLSTRATYEKGQFTIPSDTACYPAKIMHGHIEELIEKGFKTIFYPGLTYNVDEHAGDNHYNCPVVAYYAELLDNNMESLEGVSFLYPYLSVDSPKDLARTILPCLAKLDGSITKKEALFAAKSAFAAYKTYTDEVEKKGAEALEFARANGKRIMILAGRPYHIDPEVCHGIDKLANSLGFVVVSEDSVCKLAPVQHVRVLDQWTFHARLYRAAAYAAQHEDVELVQLVSFGCGVDAITTDECRDILEKSGKYYTQIKIDEITNLGAVKIRLRSLLGALDEKK